MSLSRMYCVVEAILTCSVKFCREYCVIEAILTCSVKFKKESELNVNFDEAHAFGVKYSKFTRNFKSGK